MFNWKILEILEEAEIITQIKYSVTASNKNNSVSTEGYWTFKDKTHFLQKLTTEKDVIDWIKNESIIDGKCIIEDNLKKQLMAIEPVVLKKPWILPTFTVKI
jgi:hypothetical protein